MTLPREQIRDLLYGQGHDVRFTQDSPVLPDVWAEYAERPDQPVDLLLTPYQDRGSTSLGPARLAAALEDSLQRGAGRSKTFRRAGEADHQIAVNQTTVAARLWFDELVRVVLPLSSWWHRVWSLRKADQDLRKKALGALEKMKTAPGRRWLAGSFAEAEEGHPSEVSADLYWTMLVVGAIAMSNQPATAAPGRRKPPPESWPVPSEPGPRRKYFERLFGSLAELFSGVEFNSSVPPLIHLVSRNRPATTCLSRSVPAVKADAAVNLFKIDCADITWAIADSGIDARHPAFRRRSEDGQAKPLDQTQDWSDVSRVTATYDFTIIRRILSTTDDDIASLPAKLQRILNRDPGKRKELGHACWLAERSTGRC